MTQQAPQAPPELRHSHTSLKLALLSGVAAIGLLGTPAMAQDSAALRVLTFNTWFDQFRNNLDDIAPLFVDGGYDVIAFQELYSETYLSGLQQRLRDAGLGEYAYVKMGDTGILSRVEGVTGTNSSGDSVAYQITDESSAIPETVFGSVHLDYRDTSDRRLDEVEGLAEWAKSTNRSVVLVGDYNAADTSERGLNRASQQKLILQNYLQSGNSFYGTLLEQYAVDPAAMTQFISDHSGEYLALTDIPDTLFTDEMYPVQDNLPVTMNKMKHDFIMLETEAQREPFAPHTLGDGSTTWTSVEEDHTNVWPSWDRSAIDHFMVSRPFGKWWKIVNEEDDPYTGVLGKTDVTASGKAYSDHELVAHDLAWVGPKLEYETAEGDVELTRLVWSEDVAVFDESEGEFYLSRNNMRQDVYLGQVSDAEGNPILDWLSDSEKQTLLDCETTDSRLAQAVSDYCIDDHSFISETLVQDGGTLRVDEDAALGTSAATLRLNDGGLAISGTQMVTLDRNVSLEGTTGGWLDIRDANATVVALQEISGDGALEKRGEGTLTLEADNSYTGATVASAGLLVVNGSIAQSSGVSLMDGATIGGSGTISSLTLGSGATLAAGNSIGALNIDGDLTIGSGARFEIEVNAEGDSDIVTATGDITIGDATALAMAAAGDYAPRTSYVVLQSGGAVTGRFAEVTSSLAFLDADLSYGEQDVSLSLERNDTAFDRVATTANRAATAAAVESLGFDNALFDKAVMLDAASADQAFDALSGEIYAATMTSLVDQGNDLRATALSQLRGYKGSEAPTFWMQSYGGQSDIDGDDTRNLSHSSFGTLVGVNGMLGGEWVYGAMLGYGKGTTSLDGTHNTSENDFTTLGVIAGRDFGAARLTAGASWTHSQIDSTRGVAFPDFADTLTADYGADTKQIFAEASYNFAVGTSIIQPYGSIAHVAVKTDAVSENGGDAALNVQGNDFDATVGELGVRGQMQLSDGAMPVRLSGGLGWRHVFDANAPAADMAFAGGDAFNISGTSLAEDVVKVNLSVGIDLTQSTALSLGYAGEFGDGGRGNSLAARLQVNF
ncbi:autotransporter domain-containing protein [Pseudorhodobacter turbinis]|uniref:Autotransporter domain-containing protein n=1 Tax=Pseudorhodobacter turbinis TaxID=2500533 RepID=A0A4P8EEE2_9RHOB|nr:autotransporter domain-containing protein [Pseudorhodobacter turbinis]QCO55421.1 autotransporter domain-containing protein [Pseudorhodobacter turbinis]